MQLKNTEFIEKMIIKTMLENKRFDALVCNNIDSNYFESSEAATLFNNIKTYFKEYKSLPEKEIVLNMIDEEKKEDVSHFLQECNAIDIDVSSKFDFILNETDEWIRANALKNAILSSADILNKGESDEFPQIDKLIKGALTKTLKFEMGTNYFEELGSRLQRMFNQAETRLSTGYQTLDEIMAGGIPSKSLTMFFARSHGHKCVDHDTLINVKNTKTGEEKEIKIGDFVSDISKKSFDESSRTNIKKHYEENDRDLNIIKEEFNVNEYEALTDIGWVKINKCFVTNRFKKYIILFESGRDLVCADRHLLIGENYKEILACDIKIGDKILSVDGTDVVFDVIETDEYEEFYDINLAYHHLYYTNEILSHNSGIIANFSSRQVLSGKTVIIYTMEMSEDMFGQRLDAILSGYDINRIYLDRKQELVKELTEIKKKENRGTLIIKEFPTGTASTAHFKSHLYELEMRGIKPDVIYADYVGLMRPELKMTKDAMYEMGKQISVELRALSYEFDAPVVSVSQMNRNGSRIALSEADFTDVAESYGISHTADYVMILGIDESLLTYENELLFKIVKNRYGGRVGTIGKFYVDPFTLKIYDELEIDEWLEDAEKNSAEPRKVFEKKRS